MPSKSRKLKAFLPAWMDRSLKDCDCEYKDHCDCPETVSVKKIFTGDPSNPQNAKCLVCPITPRMPFGRTFSIAEGFAAIQKHSATKEHRKYVNKPEDEVAPQAEQISIQAAMEKQEKLTEKHRSETNQLLKSQILYSHFMHKHGVPSDCFTCFSELVPRLFPDSSIAKRWGGSSGEGMRKTKGDYFLTQGIFPHFQNELVETLRKTFFSINIDESSVNKDTQLDVNVSFIKDSKAVKENLTTISMPKGTSAEEVKDITLDYIDSLLIPLSNIMSTASDGAFVMIGEEGGVQALMRQRIPHLPSWGGCSCHDCSNILKAGVAKLDPNLTELFSRLHTYLNSASMHRKRQYEDFCKENGLVPSSVPKFFEVRFRTITSCALWMEKDHRCLYLWFSKLAEDVKEGTVKDLTVAESFILKHFSSNIILLRLTNQFIIDVSGPLLTVINHFESETPNIFDRFDVLIDFLSTFLGKFLKNGGLDEGEDSITARRLLDIDVRDRNLQLSNEKLWIGPKAEAFLSQIGLTKNSTERLTWFDRVRDFYCEALTKAQKYFRPSLTSKLLRYCDIFSPRVFFATPLDELKKRVQHVSEKFPNVIKVREIPSILDQVASLKARSKAKEAANTFSPVKFFTTLLTWQEGKYKLIGKLGYAMLVIYGSSTSAERDFSLMNSLLADPRKKNTSQLRLQARLKVKSRAINLKHDCIPCQEASERKRSREEAEGEDKSEDDECVDSDVEEASEAEEVSDEEEVSDDDGEPQTKRRKKNKLENHTHCHCPMFKVSDDLLAYMGGGQPRKRYFEEQKKKREQKKVEHAILKRRKKDDSVKAIRDLKTEVLRLRRAVREESRQGTKSAQGVSVTKTQAEKKAERERRKHELAQERQAKKDELFLLFS